MQGLISSRHSVLWKKSLLEKIILSSKHTSHSNPDVFYSAYYTDYNFHRCHDNRYNFVTVATMTDLKAHIMADQVHNLSKAVESLSRHLLGKKYRSYRTHCPKKIKNRFLAQIFIDTAGAHLSTQQQSTIAGTQPSDVIRTGNKTDSTREPIALGQ